MPRKISWRKLAQPSTWAGIGILWSVFAPGNVPWDLVVNAVTAIAALLAILLDEGPGQA